MEFKTLKEEKNLLMFEIAGVSHGFCNVLKEALANESDVEVASYKVDHPLIGKPTFIIQTKKYDPKKALKSAIASVRKTNEALLKIVDKM